MNVRYDIIASTAVFVINIKEKRQTAIVLSKKVRKKLKTLLFTDRPEAAAVVSTAAAVPQKMARRRREIFWAKIAAQIKVHLFIC